jgi:hypothetical protein
MGTTMKLLKVIQELDTLDKESTIYASKPWTESSTAMVLPEPEAGDIPREADELGLNYFIEVFIAHEFLTDWEANLDKTPTIHEKCERLIQYAINDA